MTRLSDGSDGRFRLRSVAGDRHVVLPDDAVVYAIGDVHGCRSELLALERRIAADAAACSRRRFIVMLGDYVDHGPDSAGVLDHLMAPPPAGFERLCLKGNHEYFFEAFLSDPRRNLDWLRLGGAETLASYGIDGEEPADRQAMRALKAAVRELIPDEHRAFLKRLPLTVRFGDILFVHAGIRPGVALAEQTPDDLTMIREAFLGADTDPGLLVVHGHTITERPALSAFRVGLDTGAYRTGRLTALRIAADGLSLLSNLDDQIDPLPACLFAHGPGTHRAASGVQFAEEADAPAVRSPARRRVGGAVAALAAAAGVALLVFPEPPTPVADAGLEPGPARAVAADAAASTEPSGLQQERLGASAPEPELPEVDRPIEVAVPAVVPDAEPRLIALAEADDTGAPARIDDAAPAPEALLRSEDLSAVDAPTASIAALGSTAIEIPDLEDEAMVRPPAEMPAADSGLLPSVSGPPEEPPAVPVPLPRPVTASLRPATEQPARAPSETSTRERRRTIPLRSTPQRSAPQRVAPPPQQQTVRGPGRAAPAYVAVRVCEGWLFETCRMVRVPIRGIGPQGMVVLDAPQPEGGDAW